MRPDRPTSLAFVFLALPGVFCVSAARADVRVELRGGASTLEAASASVEESGIRLKGVGGIEQFARWDEVRAVTGSTVPAGIDAGLQLGETLWRARTRVVRGDYEFAEPLLREVWSSLRNPQCDLGYITAEGLLRCALARGDSVSALEPWMHVAAMKAGQHAPADSVFASLPPMLDPATLFSSEITPFATSETAARAAQVLEVRAGHSTGGSSMDERFARLLRNAPKHVEPRAGASVAEQLLATLEELALAQSDRDRARLAEGFLALARNAGGGEAPRFLLAWKSMVLGRALVGSASAESQEMGVLELLSAAVIEGETALGRLALREAASACRARGDVKSAQLLERLMQDDALDAIESDAARTPLQTTMKDTAPRVIATRDAEIDLKGNETP